MTNNPSSWPDYRSGHWNDHNAPNNTPTTVGVLPYSRAGGGVFNLQTAGQVSTLDEDDELVTNQTYTIRPTRRLLRRRMQRCSCPILISSCRANPVG